MKICLHQLVKPKHSIYVKGIGDCQICVADKDNRKCPRYYPIKVKLYEVKK